MANLAQMMATKSETDPRKSVKVGDKTFYLTKDGQFDPADFPESKRIFGVGLPQTISKDGKKSQTHFTPRVAKDVIEQLEMFQDDVIKPKSNPAFLESVVKAFVNIKTGNNNVYDEKTQRPVGALTDDQFKMIKISPNTAKKFLYIGRVAGIGADDLPTVEGFAADIPLEPDEKKFRESKPVQDWMESYPTDAEDDKAQHTLYKVLKIMNVNTDYPKLLNRLEKQEAMRQLKNLVVKKLQTWAYDKDAADPFDKGKKRSDKFKTGRGTQYFFVKYLRHFLEANNFSIPKQSRSSPLFQGVVSHGKYKDLKATPAQVEDMKVCLLDRDNHPKEITGQDGTKWKPTQEDWDDAYFYFILGMQIGFRAEEGLTLPTNMHETIIAPKNLAKYEPAKVGTKKIQTEDGSLLYKVTLYTRKTKHVLTPTHSGVVYDAEVNRLIEKRHKQVEQALTINNQADLDRLGIVKKYKTYVKNAKTGKRELKDKINTVHSLIGADGKYTSVGTLLNENPASSGKRATNRKHLRDLMRHCFTAIPNPLPDDYFGLMPLHAIRHIFAQYWLEYSDYDYGWVARLGHWKTIAELQNSYGFMDDTIYNEKWKDIHQLASVAQLKLGTKKGKLVAKRISETELAKAKKKPTALDKALDESYTDEAKILNEEVEKELEEKADEDHPLSDTEKEELGLLQEVIEEKPANPDEPDEFTKKLKKSGELFHESDEK